MGFLAASVPTRTFRVAVSPTTTRYRRRYDGFFIRNMRTGIQVLQRQALLFFDDDTE